MKTIQNETTNENNNENLIIKELQERISRITNDLLNMEMKYQRLYQLYTDLLARFNKQEININEVIKIIFSDDCS